MAETDGVRKARSERFQELKSDRSLSGFSRNFGFLIKSDGNT